jgi:hypothetical protein
VSRTADPRDENDCGGFWFESSKSMMPGLAKCRRQSAGTERECRLMVTVVVMFDRVVLHMSFGRDSTASAMRAQRLSPSASRDTWD